MTAKAANVAIEEVVFDSAHHSLKLESGATFPVLQTDEGLTLSQTSAILEYVGGESDLLGKSDFEKAQVAQWVNLIRQETWPLAKGVSAFVFGQLGCPSESEHVFIYNQLKEHIKALNNSLKSREWLVGDAMTVADLQLALAILELQQCSLGTNFRNSINNLNAHFKRVTETPLFVARCGKVKQGKKQLLPSSMTAVKETKVKVAKGKK